MTVAQLLRPETVARLDKALFSYNTAPRLVVLLTGSEVSSLFISSYTLSHSFLRLLTLACCGCSLESMFTKHLGAIEMDEIPQDIIITSIYTLVHNGITQCSSQLINIDVLFI